MKQWSPNKVACVQRSGTYYPMPWTFIQKPEACFTVKILEASLWLCCKGHERPALTHLSLHFVWPTRKCHIAVCCAGGNLFGPSLCYIAAGPCTMTSNVSSHFFPPIVCFINSPSLCHSPYIIGNPKNRARSVSLHTFS